MMSHHRKISLTRTTSWVMVPAAPVMSPASPGNVSSPLTDRITSDPPGLAAANTISLPSGPVVTRGRRTRPAAPISTTEVRRSSRSNKFNGFKSQQVTDARPVISRVKPRLITSIGSSSSAADAHEAILPPTPVPVLQDIGINRCAIPAEELTEEALLAVSSSVAPVDDASAASSSSATAPMSKDVGDRATPSSA